MSLSARNWAWSLPKEQVDPGELLVLLCLAEHENPDYGYAFPSEEILVLRTNCSRRTVTRHTASLEAKGLIRKTSRARVHGTWPSNRYYLNVPEELRRDDAEWMKKASRPVRAVS